MLAPKDRGRFSRRTAWDRSSSELQEISPATPADAVLDLTVSNPTSCGFVFDPSDILEPLLHAGSLRYDPDPKGMRSAREAVALYYAGHGAVISPDQIVLTASTSEAYSHLFRLLCDPGDEVLIAQPSYPLFDYLADLADVTLRSYPLFYDHGWWIDTNALEQAITPRTRAIVVVHPNNPTGHRTSSRERQHLFDLCRRHDLSLIVDEVFLDYAHRDSEEMESFASSEVSSLTFVLSGLSKIAALPQMKAGWIVTLGERRVRTEALERLEIIADTFLSVSSPAQLALPEWLKSAGHIRRIILDRVDENLAILRVAEIEIRDVAAGWNAILRVPRLFGDETAFATLRRAGILSHPAHFYGLPDAHRVVISLIVPAETMREATKRICELIRTTTGEERLEFGAPGKSG